MSKCNKQKTRSLDGLNEITLGIPKNQYMSAYELPYRDENPIFSAYHFFLSIYFQIIY